MGLKENISFEAKILLMEKTTTELKKRSIYNLSNKKYLFLAL